MCDYFWQRMEKGQGDLSDIFQVSGLVGPASTSADIPTITADTSWQPHLDPTASSADGFQENFTGIKDPMLHELVGTGFFGYREQLAESMAITVVKQPPLVGLTDLGKIGGGVAIPVSRTQGIKRRKNQARKVVCIPAPAAASNKPGGEVVPSDLWAWRKYGQKPIKGSPFPRGYYRCSSSKGCSARKQVERSRTDPNMLVITYTSDHNHPWPTQRNALAGSTRSQSNSKNNNNASSSMTSSINQKLVPVEKVSTREEEEEEEQEVEEEEEEAEGSAISSSLPLVRENENNTMPENFHHDFDDFFADLAVLEASPMSLDEEKSNNKAMDHFNMFGWDGGNSS